MSVKFYKRKPAFIQAIKITGTEENLKEIYEFTKGYTGASYEQFKDYFPKKVMFIKILQVNHVTALLILLKTYMRWFKWLLMH